MAGAMSQFIPFALLCSLCHPLMVVLEEGGKIFTLSAIVFTFISDSNTIPSHHNPISVFDSALFLLNHPLPSF